MKWFPKSGPAEPWLAGFVVPQNGTLASLVSPAGEHLVHHFDPPTSALPDEPACEETFHRPARRDIWLCC